MHGAPHQKTELQDIRALRHGVSTAYTSVILDTWRDWAAHQPDISLNDSRTQVDYGIL